MDFVQVLYRNFVISADIGLHPNVIFYKRLHKALSHRPRAGGAAAFGLLPVERSQLYGGL